jgi:formylglycine-generating enzyme required for sulfatase activity
MRTTHLTFTVILVWSLGAWCRAESPKLIENSIGMKLALIPAGEFVMGAPESERGRQRDQDQHRVRITKPFYMGVYEVTQAEYARVMGTNPSYFSATDGGRNEVSGLDTSRFPVETVFWTDGEELCRKLSSLPEEKAAGRAYRLPTEAEWEYACRAETSTPFYCGTQLNHQLANCRGALKPYGIGHFGLNRPTTVGSYPPNAYGLYDMHGNVWEWCQDWYSADYFDRSPVDDPQGPSTARYRVIRGGGWASDPYVCRSAHRYSGPPMRRRNNVGFRVVAVPSGK